MAHVWADNVDTGARAACGKNREGVIYTDGEREVEASSPRDEYLDRL